LRAYPIPWRLNLLIVVVQSVAAISLLAMIRHADQGWHLAILALGFAIIGNSVYAMMHEAEHGILHPNRRWNDSIGVYLALYFPAPFHLLRQGHLGHHWRNRSDDEAFDYYFEGDNPFWKWAQLYGILTGVFWLTIVLANFVVLLCPSLIKRQTVKFDRPSAALVESLNPKYWRWIRLEALLVVLFHTGLIVGLQIPVHYYALVYLGFGFSWSAMQYVHHFGTKRDVVDGAKNLWLGWPIDILWLHHNWHQVHHQHPTIPWKYLPAFGRRTGGRREFLIPQYLRMWRGPRYTDEHVENRYAGRIIR
jgi:fatty acid desaturase